MTSAKLHSIEVSDSPSAGAQFGRDVKVNFGRASNKFHDALEALDLDLLNIVGAAMVADRKFRRPRSWQRQLCVTVGVSDRAFWSRASVNRKLVDVLNVLTGDSWTLVFCELAVPRNVQQVLGLGFEPEATILPYSGGLDSYATDRLLTAQERHAPVLVHSGAATAAELTLPDRKSLVCGEVTLPGLDHPESSYRTRSLQFLVFAALAAVRTGAKRVVVPENGQGSIGISLLPLPDEPAPVGSHPALTRRLRSLLIEVWGTAPIFDHVNLWNTKGFMLQQLFKAGLDDRWHHTKSCARTLARNKGSLVAPECGACSNCVLTRLALHAAGHSFDERARYTFSDLNAASLEAALSPDRRSVAVNELDHDIAVGGILLHEQLARRAEVRDSDPTLRTAVFELARDLELSEAVVRERVRELLSRHASEWRAFVGALAPSSWVARVARGGA